MRAAIPFHRTLQKRQRCPVIQPICGKDLKHLSFVINCVPKIMSFTIDPDENLVQVTTPRPIRSIVVCLAIVIGLAGCVSKYKTDTFTGAEVQLSSEGGFYVMLAPHGTHGSKV